MARPTAPSSSAIAPHCRTLRGNLADLGLEDRSTVVTGNALVMARNLVVDLVLADPPYEFEEWGELLAAAAAPFVVAEAGADLGRLDRPAQWEIVRSRRYGRTWVTFFERTEPGINGDDE